MGYLTLSRRPGEKLHLTVAKDADIEALVQSLLTDGITIMCGEVGGGRVRLAIQAPAELKVLRAELLQEDSAASA
ncbi:carbon storage regulator [Pseudomonas oligotrophica]|uniref:carbon storage regulator n=1 Tax=Pseudomonas oligotrophica TaxID=2912055 RepID=UPI001F32CD50|nr:carbon storage regulator [Pseudomonas oligotrophica]MCF7202619.1 carbon storage regulator [Pseudomonas oligotrophica]